VRTGFWEGDLSEGDHLRDPGINWRRISKWIFKKWEWGGGAWTGFSWVRIETGGGLL
jgi:hypothetical protein